MKTSLLRQRFLDFFARYEHAVVRSSPVVGPADDPTVMWTNAGMVQFKDVFLGKEQRPYSRAASSQKCVRAGGKHNDLEHVGFTARHHTFFEMLGNFSFGDYFKKEAIAYAWEFVTGPLEEGNLSLDPQRLWVTVFGGEDGVPADEEAEAFWLEAGVPADRILRFGKKDNFWQMGDTGPCGPCSEMHYDRGPQVSGDSLPNGEGDRVMEIWNLVFMQFDRDASGKLTPLPKPSIDTGMGLERTASILQNVDSNYEIDLFQPIFRAIWKAAPLPDENRAERANRIASQVIADHIRAATFMIFDGVVPSNEGRGYVLRKIIRRALRFGKKLGIQGAFFASLAPSVLEAMGDAYPELDHELPRIQKILAREESQFSTTLNAGLKLLEGLDVSIGELRGSDIFKLYDTYGFPVDLVQDWCKERGILADMSGFEHELEDQRARGRAAMKQHDLSLQGDLAKLPLHAATQFLGYDSLEAKAKVLALFDAKLAQVNSLAGEGYALLDRTPFYAQSGGQVGDTGQFVFEHGTAEVLDCTAPATKRSLHKIRVRGTLQVGTEVEAKVDVSRRARIRAHHTATHMLHAALREVLGTHVKQAGSMVDPERLRFDFSHFTALEPDQIEEIERRATEQALKGVAIATQEMEIEEALSTGAMALFGEKYGEKVRVVSVPGFSTELCGGTHVKTTGEIGCIKIVTEGAIAAGVRRIEAVAGLAALELLQDSERRLGDLVRRTKAPKEALSDWITAKDSRIAQLEKDLKEAKLKAASGSGEAEQIQNIGSVPLVTLKVEGLDAGPLRELMDQVRTRHRNALIALASVTAPDKCALLISAAPELGLDAGALLKTIAPAIEGRGGGKKDLAQGGGTKPNGLDEAFNLLAETIRKG